ncbi:redox-active disulfide protein 2 [Hymenobacter monticola]|uniref:Redox-active disulfide protein 2 n=1 Tax=Hymenobacter monticola TaxID=1705399 RepID=A0ABY4B1Q0_9BACT|nr:redox-active disulfide protein 2 [Hymenobacter monticola]UOE33082.1 redox-active disulfide protein 2 [Hymenobacter monticola]
MKPEDLKTLSSEELLKRQKTIKLVSGALAAMLLILLVMGISLTIQKKRFVSLIVIPFSLLPILMLNLTIFKKIKDELYLRKNTQQP